MCAAHFRLSNLCAIVDYNKIQSDARNEEIMELEPLAAKWRVFNWSVVEIDGHDFMQIRKGLEEAKQCTNQPVCIIAHTVKGKGVAYMEGSPLWHGSVRLTRENLEEALSSLGVSFGKMNGVLDEPIS